MHIINSPIFILNSLYSIFIFNYCHIWHYPFGSISPHTKPPTTLVVGGSYSLILQHPISFPYSKSTESNIFHQYPLRLDLTFFCQTEKIHFLDKTLPVFPFLHFLHNKSARIDFVLSSP